MLRQKRLHGAVQPPSHGGGKPRTLTAQHLKVIRRWLIKEPDLTLSEIREKMLAEQQKTVSIATLGKVLQAARLTRKKITHGSEKNQSPAGWIPATDQAICGRASKVYR